MTKNINTYAIYLVICTSLMISCSNNPETLPSQEQLLRLSYNSQVDHKERDFFVYLPRGYKDQPKKQWPVLLFLHGNGERGNGKDELDYVLLHGPLYEAWIQKRNLPFIIISPQLHMFGMDTIHAYIKNRIPEMIPQRLEDTIPERQEESAPQIPMRASKAEVLEDLHLKIPPYGWEQAEQDLIGILDTVMKEFHTDKNRVYLTGLSYGGFGTWHLASQYPNRFAAICPIVGWGTPEQMLPIAQAQLPVWTFAGGRDPVVLAEDFFPALNKLEALGHQQIRFTVHEDAGHDVWKRIYGGEDIYHWFLQFD